MPSTETSRKPLLRRLWRRLNLEETATAPAPADEQAWRERQATAGFRAWTAVFVGIALMTVLWWPTDLLVFRGQPNVIAAFAISRSVSATATTLTLLLVYWVSALRRRWLSVLTALACFNIGVWSYQFGELGGPDRLWFNFLPQLIYGGMAVALTRRSRIAVTCALALSMLTGYFGLHPHYLLEPFAAPVLSCLLCTTLAAIGCGMLMDHLRRQAFLLRRSAERQARTVEALNGQLESRVAEQTSELRGLTQRLETAREAERVHIARELHDELGQQLTALRLALKFTRVRYERDGAHIGRNLEELEDLLARTTATTRGILLDLRPRVLDDLGLSAAAEWLVERTRQRSGLVCRLELPDETLQLNDELDTAAYRLLQEALTNVMRHAKASEVEVAIRNEPNAIALLVRDDGVGFDRAGAGFGVIGMRERAKAIGGEFQLESAPGRGTTVRVRLPKPAQVSP